MPSTVRDTRCGCQPRLQEKKVPASSFTMRCRRRKGIGPRDTQNTGAVRFLALCGVRESVDTWWEEFLNGATYLVYDSSYRVRMQQTQDNVTTSRQLFNRRRFPACCLRCSLNLETLSLNTWGSPPGPWRGLCLECLKPLGTF